MNKNETTTIHSRIEKPQSCQRWFILVEVYHYKSKSFLFQANTCIGKISLTDDDIFSVSYVAKHTLLRRVLKAAIIMSLRIALIKSLESVEKEKLPMREQLMYELTQRAFVHTALS